MTHKLIGVKNKCYKCKRKVNIQCDDFTVLLQRYAENFKRLTFIDPFIIHINLLSTETYPFINSAISFNCLENHIETKNRFLYLWNLNNKK